MEKDNFLPDKLVNWMDIARGVGDVVFHGIFDQFRHEGRSNHFQHTDEPEPEDTLASHSQLFTPEWKKNLPDMDYIDPTQHLRVPHDSEGNYHNPDGDLVA